MCISPHGWTEGIRIHNYLNYFHITNIRECTIIKGREGQSRYGYSRSDDFAYQMFHVYVIIHFILVIVL